MAGVILFCRFRKRAHLYIWQPKMSLFERMRLHGLEKLLALLRRLGKGRLAALPAHLLTGVEGESAAYFYLRRKGYAVVARRWGSSSQPGDLDLVAWQGQQLCFIEVKTRTAHDAHAAEVAVDADKRATLRRLARMYLQKLPGETPPPVRFDILSVYLIAGHAREFQHFEGAFGWSERRSGERWGDRG
jgi:putative endonuclease